MSIPTEWGLPFEFPLFPYEFVVGIENDEVVDICGWDEVLLAPCPGVDGPASEEDDVRAADVGGVAVAGKRRGA